MWNEISCTKLQLPPEPLTKGLPPPDPRPLCPQLNFLKPPPEKNSWVRHWFWWILKCRWNIHWVTTTESLFLKYISTVKARCSTDQRSMSTEMLWVSLEGSSRTNSPTQRFHSQLCCQIIRCFCWTLYNNSLPLKCETCAVIHSL